jgi:hypothetical protein
MGERLAAKSPFPLYPPIADVRKRDYNLTVSGKATAFVAGVLLASLFWIVLAQQKLSLLGGH